MQFVFVSGNAALDLLGTLKWRRTEPEEGLDAPGAAARWAVEAGLLTDPPASGTDDLTRLLALREATYRLVRGVLAGDDPGAADLRTLNEAAAGTPAALTLTARGAQRAGDLDAAAAEVARAAVTLLGEMYGETPPRVRECERAACTRLFVDRSRGGTRSWCGMSECGNRVKAREYRARKAARLDG
ncbi:putative RNA-binding Zn ribbon-like protein [Actinoplanes lutulentus]|uniref:Putative RNA-binding Zn ribbon-like protein n=1 Tax=Actinoplanes lutulentus TaxID=1287878 RepID=A0A327Z3Q4_9ACTN|nr:ABATE domain-containing protein [Actinoplanes lutulentus]MBB2948323.1 putative RNA-binding Zn ribbon-like protein [Actinoplanes lutulentus]RAK30355.1 putative RNA-binding Zn ribbon-like protein [Actinoplanes lutulentus]